MEQEDEQIDNVTFILETRQDYEEAVAALDESIEAAQVLSISIARLAESLETYESKHNINRDYSD